MNYDERIRQLQREKEAAIQAAEDARKRADRQAFWRGEVAPKLALWLGLPTLLILLGKGCNP